MDTTLRLEGVANNIQHLNFFQCRLIKFIYKTVGPLHGTRIDNGPYKIVNISFN